MKETRDAVLLYYLGVAWRRAVLVVCGGRRIKELMKRQKSGRYSLRRLDAMTV